MVHLPFYGTQRYCHDWDGIAMGACPERDEGEDENGERRWSKIGVDSDWVGDAKYEGVGGRKICVERAEGLDYFQIIEDDGYRRDGLDGWNKYHKVKLGNQVVFNKET